MSKFEIAVRLYKSYLITEALKDSNGNQCAAARKLGLHRNSLARNVKILGIKLEKPAPPPEPIHKPTPVAAAALESIGKRIRSYENQRRA